jgi:hypothetical protein
VTPASEGLCVWGVAHVCYRRQLGVGLVLLLGRLGAGQVLGAGQGGGGGGAGCRTRSAVPVGKNGSTSVKLPTKRRGSA